MHIDEQDLNSLQQAKQAMANPALIIQLSNKLGSPIEQAMQFLPTDWQQVVNSSTEKALQKAVETAISTLNNSPGNRASEGWHKVGAATVGGAGGFFGLAGLALELPVSTTLILRSIADIARSEGESLVELETQLACLEVFALGGISETDDAGETAYFTVRSLLAKSISDASEHILQKGICDQAAPALVKLIGMIAKRFGIQVSQKAAAQTLPAIGAAGGAVINTLFIGHFQSMARAHFIIRRLERKYGCESVQAAFQQY